MHGGSCAKDLHAIMHTTLTHAYHTHALEKSGANAASGLTCAVESSSVRIEQQRFTCGTYISIWDARIQYFMCLGVLYGVCTTPWYA